jgi:IS4 transposase
MFPWAKYQRAKGGIKLHVLLDNADYMPVFMSITDANTYETRQVNLLKLAPGSIVVMDKAYTEHSLFGRWTKEGVFFVTRMRDNAVYEVVSQREVPQDGNILSDEVIRLTGKHAMDNCPHCLRRIAVWDSEHEREFVFLTNHFDFEASTISNIYRERWQIEVFFKTLKQNLKIKTFVGTSENAVRIQIWTALIALLLLKWLHYLSNAKWSLSNLASLLRLNLFTYRSLLEWLNDPFNTPPVIPDSVQLKLPM